MLHTHQYFLLLLQVCLIWMLDGGDDLCWLDEDVQAEQAEQGWDGMRWDEVGRDAGLLGFH